MSYLTANWCFAGSAFGFLSRWSLYSWLLGTCRFVCMAFNQCQECQSFVIVAVDSRTSFVATLSSCNSLSAIFVHAYSHLRTSMYNICTVIFLGPLSSHMFSQPFFAAAGIAGYKLNMRLGEASEGEICCHNNVRKRLKCAKWRRSQSNWWVSSPDIQYTAFRPHQLTGRCSGKFRCKGTQFGRSRGQVKTLPILISKTLAQRLRDTEKSEKWFWMEMVALESLDLFSNWCGCQFRPQMACKPV